MKGGEAWCATAHGVAKSRTKLSDSTATKIEYCAQKWQNIQLFQET